MSGGYDGKLNVCDVRSNDTLTYLLNKKVCKDIESCNWHPKQEHALVVTTESGIVYGFDTRKFTAPSFEIAAHKKACSGVSFSPHIPNLMATVGTDHMCKLWDLNT